jgi:hypothetical protein
MMLGYAIKTRKGCHSAKDQSMRSGEDKILKKPPEAFQQHKLLTKFYFHSLSLLLSEETKQRAYFPGP